MRDSNIKKVQRVLDSLDYDLQKSLLQDIELCNTVEEMLEQAAIYVPYTTLNAAEYPCTYKC